MNDSVRNPTSAIPERSPRLLTYFTGPEWLAFALFILSGILLRWCGLEDRPYHHDESQHAMFGKYFYDWPEIQYYKYDPMMHAPLLYNLLRAVYTAFGHTLWSARVPIALLGTIFLFVPLLFRRYFSPTALLALTGALALSPNMIYWSRFLIHDYLVIAALILTLYGAVQSAPERRSIFVILGIALQFCVKANVYVTLAMLGGYLLFEAAFRCFILNRSEKPLSSLANFLLKYLLIFLAIFAIAVCFLHFGISSLIEHNDKWKALIGDLAQHKLGFILTTLVFSLIAYVAVAFMTLSKESLLARISLNIKTYWKQCLSGLAVSTLVYCYITTSGFRFMRGILDVIFRESIPYWWNQHNIERIQGPFLFHFYMFSWYELIFMLFLAVHLYFFYRSAPKATKIAGLAMVGTAAFFALLTLGYIAPESDNGAWLSVADLSKKPSTGIWKIIFAVWGEFKVKDCLDIFGLFLLLIHPLIVTSTHLARREFTLGFWAYCFTASFFSYSFVGEKVPWLCVYPLAAGFIYLTLYFDDWFNRHPISSYREYPLERIFRSAGIFFLALGVAFIIESVFSVSALFAGQMMSKLQETVPDGSILGLWRPIAKGVEENLLIFLIGFSLYALHFSDRWTGLLGKVHLKRFIFILAGIYCLRASILTNFVYAGAENEYISQVHTTKEFHDAALKLRELSLNNLREDPFTIFGDGDPVWPLTWYMIGVNDFKFIASSEEKKQFDYMIVTWKENPTDVPEGFEKKRLNLRGWWVPDFNQVTLKKFLNYSLNHFPWSGSGFTYVWLYRNKSK